MNDSIFFHLLQNALNAQRVAGLIKTAETMGILDTSTESTKQSDIDEILGFLAALEKVHIFNFYQVVIILYDIVPTRRAGMRALVCDICHCFGQSSSQ